jgi:MerR family transcriptional regulator/heat shock protein HspR
MSARYSEPLFVISVAARLVEMHPQTLRKYEREGLIAPSRTSGNLRLYSDSDIERLRQVKYLVDGRGLNLAGVQLALELTARLRELRGRLDGDAGASAGENGTGARGSRATAELSAQTRRELDGILAMLGFVDQSEVRARYGDRASGD